ncbi:MAG: glycine--tRNA ligase subunit beta [Proteobacteria bacterium]|jgi:glycyl-tRNA synthetase beta chain|nr:glycine--tRNA ligase subunit beta [Pseudomonadota bacterium]
MNRDLLIEIGTEELPPKALQKLSQAFSDGITTGLDKATLNFETIKSYASPRRLAVLIGNLMEQTPDQEIERRGPALQAAFGEDGCATKAAEGFARSCGVVVEDLEKLETDAGSWLVYRSHQKGQPASVLIPDIVNQALEGLPIPRRMRWGDLDTQFVRPVHWVVLLFGNEVIDAEILGIRTGRATRGHRFHHPAFIEIPAPAEYEVLLESEGKVIADFDRRAETIRARVESAALELNGRAVIDATLLNEVTAMVEWPVAVTGHFEARFLSVPHEALISTMSANQKYFHLVDANNQLLPYFITVSNIESTNPDTVRIGNERVIRPRFSDAEFFWNQDRKQRLDKHLLQLKTVVFQQKLGSLFDKTQRVAKLAASIAELTNTDRLLAVRSAELSKCDLMTDMVGEFPGLQGIMGRYYAEHDGEDQAVCRALDDYYKPRFAGDSLPDDNVSQTVALADRIDTLLGIFAIGQIPTGDKDPYALRRAALGLLRILIERQIDLDLKPLLKQAATNFPDTLHAGKAIDQVLGFVLDRLRAYYLDQGIRPDVIEAVAVQHPTRPVDIDRRIKAVTAFRHLPEAESLAAANKRIGNILKKVEGTLPETVDPSLLQEAAERHLHQALNELSTDTAAMLAAGDYEPALQRLATLRKAVDTFFDDVLVMDNNNELRTNRIALLNQLHGLFLQVADISRLQE